MRSGSILALGLCVLMGSEALADKLVINPFPREEDKSKIVVTSEPPAEDRADRGPQSLVVRYAPETAEDDVIMIDLMGEAPEEEFLAKAVVEESAPEQAQEDVIAPAPEKTVVKIKEIPVVQEVEVEVIKEVIKEVPVVQEIEIIKEVPVVKEVEVVKEVVKEVIKEVPVLKDRPMIWRAVRGADMRDILHFWAKDAEVNLVWLPSWGQPVKETLEIQGEFPEAVQALLDQYNARASLLNGTLYVDPQTQQQTLVIESTI